MELENKKDKIIIEDYNLQELLEFLKKETKIQVKALVSLRNRGSFQVRDEKKYEADHNDGASILIDPSNNIYNDIYDQEGLLITTNDNYEGEECLVFDTDNYNSEYQEDFNFNKKVYGYSWWEWIEVDIDINWLISEIEQYEEEERLEKCYTDLVHERWSDYTPPEAIVENTLTGEEIDWGNGTDIGKDDITWSCIDEVNESEITLTLNKIAD